MKPALYLLMLVVASVTSSWLSAAEPTPAPQAQKPGVPVATDDKNAKANDAKAKAGEQTKDAQAAADSEKAAQKSEADKATAEKAGSAKSSPQRFIPSEQVRADFDVSFPVDI